MIASGTVPDRRGPKHGAGRGRALRPRQQGEQRSRGRGPGEPEKVVPMTPRAVIRGVGVLVLVPIGLSLWLLTVSLWLTICGGANLAFAVRNDSAPALSRSAEAFARAMGVASVVAKGWGSPAPVVRPLNTGPVLG